MKAHGVPALIRYLGGEITREAAAKIGRADTRHYAKRQLPGSGISYRSLSG